MVCRSAIFLIGSLIMRMEVVIPFIKSLRLTVSVQVGEEINEKIKDFLLSGMKKGDLRDDIKIMPTILQFWGMLSGLIQLAANKEEYIEKTIHLSKIQFLEYGFDMLYRSIEKEGVK